MNDPEIRNALIAHLACAFEGTEGTLIVEEINVCRGRSRVDLAVVSETSLHGYEIKSRVDSLCRLAHQVSDYTAVFDRVTVVAGVNHLSGLLRDLPPWCGLLLASRVGGEVVLEEFRPSRTNLHRDRHALAQLLWRDEALAALKRRGLDRGVRSKTRTEIWARMALELTVEELQHEICYALRRRKSEWREDARLRPKVSVASGRRRRTRGRRSKR